VFAIAPAGTRPLWLLVPAILVMLVALGALATSALGSRRARFDVSAEGLRVRGDWYGRFIPGNALVTDRARRVDFARMPELRPGRRTLGTGLPGHQAGWFRLANGEKALLYLTDRKKAVHVPTTLGHSLLLSPDEPDSFLVALRSLRAHR
jgi:hypothetical protein